MENRQRTTNVREYWKKKFQNLTNRLHQVFSKTPCSYGRVDDGSGGGGYGGRGRKTLRGRLIDSLWPPPSLIIVPRMRQPPRTLIPLNPTRAGSGRRCRSTRKPSFTARPLAVSSSVLRLPIGWFFFCYEEIKTFFFSFFKCNMFFIIGRRK